MDGDDLVIATDLERLPNGSDLRLLRLWRQFLFALLGCTKLDTPKARELTPRLVHFANVQNVMQETPDDSGRARDQSAGNVTDPCTRMMVVTPCSDVVQQSLIGRRALAIVQPCTAQQNDSVTNDGIHRLDISIVQISIGLVLSWPIGRITTMNGQHEPQPAFERKVFGVAHSDSKTAD